MSLTKKQQAVYRFIKGFYSSKERMPTYEEIGEWMGFTEQNARKYILRLNEKGYLEKIDPNKTFVSGNIRLK